MDLDGTIAHYDHEKFNLHAIGAPIPLMVERVKLWILAGYEVRIFTARAAHKDPVFDKVLAVWTKKHIGKALKATCMKDFQMIALFDDRAVAIEMNTGRILGGAADL